MAVFVLLVPAFILCAAEPDGEKKSIPASFRQKNDKTLAVRTNAAPASSEGGEEAESEEQERDGIDTKKLLLNTQSILIDNDIVAYYGHPSSRGMGIIGRMSKENLLKRLSAQAEEYRAVSGGRNVLIALYIIFGTCQPGGEIGIINKNVLKDYIEFAAENNMIVFLDHQIGKYDTVASLKRMLPYLKEYPNVHLALDPEWHTEKPMREIGSVTADELNRAQEMMEQYMIENDIAGERLLVIHQFNSVMIKNRRAVRANFDRVRLVLCMDGHGTPKKKRDSYEFNALATNIPVKAFKLFYNEKGNTGVDEPLLTPKQVYELKPRPLLIMYQ